MRVYLITEHELARAGLAGHPRSGFRFPPGSYDAVDDPAKADVIISPLALMVLPTVADLERVPYYREHAAKMAFFDVSDNPDDGDARQGRFMYRGSPSMFLRCNVRSHMLAAAPNTIPCSWPVGKLDLDRLALTEDRVVFSHDIGFHGWMSSPCRITAVDSVRHEFGSRADLITRKEFYGYIHRDRPNDADKMRRNFLESMWRCRIQLCPASIPGVLPYRAWESMCAKRVAVIFCDVAQWPFEDEAPYDKFCFRFHESDAHDAGKICRQILQQTSDDKLSEMGMLAREWFVSRFDDRRWPEIHKIMIERHLKSRGML